MPYCGYGKTKESLHYKIENLGSINFLTRELKDNRANVKIVLISFEPLSTSARGRENFIGSVFRGLPWKFEPAEEQICTFLISQESA